MISFQLLSLNAYLLDTPYGNVDDIYLYFKELLLCHSVKVGVFLEIELILQNIIFCINLCSETAI